MNKTLDMNEAITTLVVQCELSGTSEEDMVHDLLNWGFKWNEIKEIMERVENQIEELGL